MRDEEGETNKQLEKALNNKHTCKSFQIWNAHLWFLQVRVGDN